MILRGMREKEREREMRRDRPLAYSHTYFVAPLSHAPPHASDDLVRACVRGMLTRGRHLSLLEKVWMNGEYPIVIHGSRVSRNR